MKLPIRALLRCSLMLLALGLAGCSDDKSSVNAPPNGDAFPAATTPEQLIENLEEAITTLDLEEFARLLHEDYRFWFSPDDIHAAGVTNWSRAEELAAITQMFSGEEGTRGEGESTEVVPAILSFAVSLEIDEAWTDSFDNGPEFADADLRGFLSCNMTVRYIDAERISEVGGGHYLYLAAVLVDVDGALQTQFQIIGWKDVGSFYKRSSTDTDNWGSLKVRFAPED